MLYKRVIAGEPPHRDRAAVAQEAGSRCLRRERHAAPCVRCIVTCPTRAIVPVDRGITIGAQACMGCGICAVVCPVGALEAPSFAAPPPDGASVRITCARAPDDGDAGWVVPCLGGVSPSVLAAGGGLRPGLAVLVVDHGWCETCPVGNGVNHAATLCDRLTTAFELAGSRIRVKLEAAPLALSAAAPAGAAPTRDRRAVFRALLRGAPAPLARGVAAERAALASIDPQAPVYPAIDLAATCADHGVCAAACPTGALSRHEDDDATMRLRFDPAHCIDCQRCVSACPGGALTLRRHATAAPDVVTLRERRLPVCLRCERTFVPEHTAQAECTACRKDIGLFLDLRRPPSQGTARMA